MAASFELIALESIGEIMPGMNLAAELLGAFAASVVTPRPGDLLVLAQKIVSKAEGRLVALEGIAPSPRALDLAAKAQKDPRLVELILQESTEVVRCVPGVIIVRNRQGVVLANAGIDQSNVRQEAGAMALLWPADPDASAADLRHRIKDACGIDMPVIINDSLGRAWRSGTIGTAIGASGIATLADMRGQADRHGRALVSTEIGTADEIAAAASLLMGQAAEGRPAILVRGLKFALNDDAGARDLIREAKKDLFP